MNYFPRKVSGMLLVVFIFAGCVHQEYGGLYRGATEHLKYETTGFRTSKPVQTRLLLRPVQDTRFKYVGTDIAGKKAMLIDSAFQRDMAAEFEIALEKELNQSGMFKDVIITSSPAFASDYTLDVDLRILYSEILAFMVMTTAFSGVRFNFVLKKNQMTLRDGVIEGTGKEGEKKSKGFGVSTPVGSMDEVLGIALRKTMNQLLSDIERAA